MGVQKNDKLPLKIDIVHKSFSTKKILDGVSFDVHKGEIFGLIGLNGIGKTTLIKIILDLLKADAGKVEFFTKSALLPKSRKQIAYLPEKFYPSPFLKGEEFLSLSLSFYGKKINMIRAKKYAKMLGLDPDVLHHKIGKYSKGMGQKLGLLSVFLTRAPLLILDEPMSGLDPRARIQLKDIFTDYKKKGNSIFFSSHILADIEEICDRIAIIHDTKLIFLGTAKDFLDQSKEKNLERAFLKAIS